MNSVTNRPFSPKTTLGHGNKNTVINNDPSHPKPAFGHGNKNSVTNHGPPHPKPTFEIGNVPCTIYFEDYESSQLILTCIYKIRF
jgi:hypothetical protein